MNEQDKIKQTLIDTKPHSSLLWEREVWHKVVDEYTSSRSEDDVDFDSYNFKKSVGYYD